MRNSLWFILAALGVAACAAEQDAVVLANGQRITGVVDPSESHDDLVAIRTDTGILRIRRDLLRSQERSYKSRRAEVEGHGNTPVDLFELAKWCLEQKDRVHAGELLRLAIAKDDASSECFGLLAKMLDQDHDVDHAFPMYQDYLKHGGTDPGLLARLQQLDEYDRQYTASLLGTKPGPADPATPLPGPPITAPLSAQPTVDDGLEARTGWEAESPQWSNPVKAEVVTLDNGGKANKVLRITYSADDKPRDKAAIRHTLPISFGDTAILSFYANNQGDQPIKVGIAVKTGKDYVFHESQPVIILADKEWKQVRFNLHDQTFKSEASKWQPSGPIADLNDVQELQILLYNGRNQGELLLDGMTFLLKNDL